MHIHLKNGGTSLVFNFAEETIEISHWGAELAEVTDESLKITKRAVAHGDLDVNPRNLALREHSRGWRGHPALRGHRSGKSVSNHFILTSHQASKDSLTANFEDKLAGLAITIEYKLDSHGILSIQSSLTNIADGDYQLEHLLTWLPLPQQANQVLDFFGRWTKERQAQRRDIAYGLTSREIYEGRSGHDYTITQIALNKGTDFQNGEAWSMGVAWSGNNIHHVEKLVDDNISIGAGELLLPGEIILAKGESYKSPKIIASYSAEGLDGITNRHYAHIRARDNHPKKARPLTLNMWEAVYFDHNFDKLSKIVNKAAELGVERGARVRTVGVLEAPGMNPGLHPGHLIGGEAVLAHQRQQGIDGRVGAAAAGVLLDRDAGAHDVQRRSPGRHRAGGVVGAGAVEDVEEALLVLEHGGGVGGEAALRQACRVQAVARAVAHVQRLGVGAEVGAQAAGAAGFHSISVSVRESGSRSGPAAGD